MRVKGWRLGTLAFLLALVLYLAAAAPGFVDDDLPAALGRAATAAIGAANVALLWLVLGCLARAGLVELSVRGQLLATVIFAVATIQWAASVAGVGAIASGLATTFFLLYLAESTSGRRAALAGALLAVATLLRPPLALGAVFCVWLRLAEAKGGRGGLARGVAVLLAPVAAAVGLLLAGVVPLAGGLSPGEAQPYGPYDVHFLPGNLYRLALEPPVLLPRPPYLGFDSAGVGLFFTAGYLVFSLRSRTSTRFQAAAWLSLGLMGWLMLMEATRGGSAAVCCGPAGWRPEMLPMLPLLVVLASTGLAGLSRVGGALAALLIVVALVFNALLARWIVGAEPYDVPLSTLTKAGPDRRITFADKESEFPALAWSGSELGVAWGDLRDPPFVPQIYFRRLNPRGLERGAELRLTSTGRHAEHPSLVFTGQGYGLAWQDARSGVPETYFRLLTTRGDQAGPERVMTGASGVAAGGEGPSLAWNGREFALVYERHLGAGNTEVFLRRLSPSGEPLGPEIQVSRSAGPSRGASVASATAGYAVAWEEEEEGFAFAVVALVGGDGRPEPRARLVGGERPALAWDGARHGLAWLSNTEQGWTVRFARLSAAVELEGAGLELGVAKQESQISLVATGGGWAASWDGPEGVALAELSIDGQRSSQRKASPAGAGTVRWPRLVETDRGYAAAWSEWTWGPSEISVVALPRT